MPKTTTSNGSTPSLPQLLSELWELVVTYARQETIDPIKGIGRFVAFGLAGSFALGIGLVLLVLAGLRAIQEETGSTFDEGLSFVPYLIVLVGCAFVILLALRATKARRGAR